MSALSSRAFSHILVKFNFSNIFMESLNDAITYSLDTLTYISATTPR